jgi:D-alanyl-D-alanine carboxypeptidase/D-alanyl-D-alanine-endopeptidase (penicillin-binding protein 4)
MRSLLLVAALLPAVAAGRDIPDTVRRALAAAGVPATAAAVVVAPAEGGAPLIAHGADAPMNPASLMKLFTAYAALDLLGPAFTFRTDFLVEGEISSGVLDGDLVIRGGGDPKLTYERVWQAAHQLRARGLREIHGDVVVDRGYFSAAAYDPGKFDGEPRRAYNVGPDPLLVNFQAVQFTFTPEGNGVRVTADPDLPNVEIASRVRLVPGACGAWRGGLEQDVARNGLIVTVAFGGTLAAECGERTLTLSVLDAAPFTEAVWRWAWGEAGGVLRGRVREGSASAGARLLYRNASEPLASLVRDMNKHSNNVMAREIYLGLAAELARPADLAASERIVRDWLAAKRIPAAGLVLDNGSGLSREARASASTIASLLQSAWSSALMPEIVSSLPLFAVDGTLRLRPATQAAGKAHLKGGTLTGVQSVAGYVLDRSGRRWIVVMIVNHPNANASQGALDALVEWVHDQARKAQ